MNFISNVIILFSLGFSFIKEYILKVSDKAQDFVMRIDEEVKDAVKEGAKDVAKDVAEGAKDVAKDVAEGALKDLPGTIEWLIGLGAIGLAGWGLYKLWSSKKKGNNNPSGKAFLFFGGSDALLNAMDSGKAVAEGAKEVAKDVAKGATDGLEVVTDPEVLAGLARKGDGWYLLFGLIFIVIGGVVYMIKKSKKKNENINSSVKAFLFFGSLDAISPRPAENWQLGFQAPASPTAEGIISFHDDLMIFLSFILGFVMYILYVCVSHFTKGNGESDRVVHASTLEIIWTIIPAVILIIIAVPSFSLLYSIDEEVVDAFATLKLIGHQWYWSYHWVTPNVSKNFVYEDTSSSEEVLNEWSNFFDSYMLSDEELMELLEKKKNGETVITPYRLLTVDNFIYLPIQKNIRLLISSSDVLHSWAVPSLGVKADACPGRLNRTNIYIKKPGIFYGQCSEICGVNHGFMPIGLIGVYYLDNSLKVIDTFDWELIIAASQNWNS